MIRKWSSFWRIEPKQRTLLLQALVLLPLVALSLKFCGLNRTQTALSRLLPTLILSQSSDESLPQVLATARMVRTAARYYTPWANCLKKSLVLWWLLRRQGIASNLQIGVRNEQGKFEAHAWVEYDGIVLNDTQNVRSHFAIFKRPILT
ncbi:MAG: lasso peptide biosynthesis B2 protein [Crinalium sp.]